MATVSGKQGLVTYKGVFVDNANDYSADVAVDIRDHTSFTTGTVFFRVTKPGLAGGTATVNIFYDPNADTLYISSLQDIYKVPNASHEFGVSTTLEVAIDVKPGGVPNSINVKIMGNFAVAILTTSAADGDAVDFDAVAVDGFSVKFGPSEAGKAHPTQPLGHIEDVDGDGDLDLLLHFDRQQTGIACGDTEATLTGATLGGQLFEGTDSVEVVPCR